MVPFAGYEMPVHYPAGILAEHLHTRAQAGLFDVSHMGQLRLAGADPAAALETLVPGDISGLGPMRMRYTLLLNDAGGILDDLMTTRLGDGLFVVVNAATKDADFAHLRDHLGRAVALERLDDRALLALQGPAAAAVLARLAAGVARLPFMTAAEVALAGHPCLVTRSGYTGEDGFEISLPAADAPALAERLLAEPEVDADRARRPRFAAPRSRALPLRPRHRRDDDPDRGRSRLDDRQEAARGGRLSGRGGHLAPARRGSAAQARRHPPRRPRAGARGDGDRSITPATRSAG